MPQSAGVHLAQNTGDVIRILLAACVLSSIYLWSSRGPTMTTITRNPGKQDHPVEPASPSESGLSLDQYVRDSSQKVDEITRQVQGGKALDFESRDWMLDQVNFIVEAIGDESLNLDEALRSNLLQLLMALVNLNEHVRQAAPDLSRL